MNTRRLWVTQVVLRGGSFEVDAATAKAAGADGIAALQIVEPFESVKVVVETAHPVGTQSRSATFPPQRSTKADSSGTAR